MELKKYKNSKKMKSYVLVIIGLFLISIESYFLYESYALYEEAKDFNIINGNVEDPGDIYFAYYIDGEISREMPVQNTGYTLDETKSNCNNNVTVTWDNAIWEAKANYKNYNATTNTRTKCSLYFKKDVKVINTVLGNIEVNTYTPDFTKSACDDSFCESHEKGIYETTDYDGNPTYYYRGSVENNYVKFAGLYWRIIRINSNGSIRMIYDGTTAHQNGEASEDRQYGISQFNANGDNNMYLGYMYTDGEAHGTSTSSTLKINVDKFYVDKLTNYALKLDTSIGFCGDRSALTLQNGVGTGTIATYNKGYIRVEKSLPNLICENESDYYTINTATIGNKGLSYPIAIISVDEVIFAGFSGGIFNGSYNISSNNVNNYLTSGTTFSTMTPVGAYIPYGDVDYRQIFFKIFKNGIIDDEDVRQSIGYRPVINIRSDVGITGHGTMTDPYVVN